MAEETWKKRLTFQPKEGTSILDAFSIASELPEPAPSMRQTTKENNKEIDITNVPKKEPWYWSGEGKYAEPKEYERRKTEEHNKLMSQGRSPNLTPREKNELERKRRQEALQDKTDKEMLKRAEFDQWRSSPAGAPLRFGEKVLSRTFGGGKLRQVPSVKGFAYKRPDIRTIEKKKMNWYSRR